MGAGGGGFFMFYCSNGKSHVADRPCSRGPREIKFRIDTEGSKVLMNLR